MHKSLDRLQFCEICPIHDHNCVFYCAADSFDWLNSENPNGIEGARQEREWESSIAVLQDDQLSGVATGTTGSCGTY